MAAGSCRASPLRFLLFLAITGALVEATTFTFVNSCPTTVWPGALSNAGSAALETTGFELPSGAALAVAAPSGWSGRFWARTGCSFGGGAAGAAVCATGDCGSGAMECRGAGAAPPATLAEFTLASAASSLDFYDVSLVDGYNLPILVEAVNANMNANSNVGSSSCAAAGCVVDVNTRCPAELRVGAGDAMACKSACEAFAQPEYCCSGEYANPNTCRPTMYSQLFKSACPRSYSYAFDDPTSTFTCAGGADYTITFCPTATPSEKATTTVTPTSTASTGGTTATDPVPSTIITGGFSTYTGASTRSDSPGDGVAQENGSWLAALAMDASGTTRSIGPFICHSILVLAVTPWLVVLPL